MRRAIARSAGVLASAICVLPFAALAADPPVTALGASPAHSTLDDAARAGVRAAFDVSIAFEAGGALLKCADGYYFSDPVSAGLTHHLEFRASVPKGCAIAGMYHTHPSPAGDYARFSVADVRMVRALSLPSYIGVAADQNIRVLTPKDAAPSGYQARKSQEVIALAGRLL